MPTTTNSRSGAFQQHPLVHRKSSPHSQSRAYIVIFDADIRNHVHIFYFDIDLNLVHIGKNLELFMALGIDAPDRILQTVKIFLKSKISMIDDTYVKEMYLKGGKYFLYVHDYLHYSLLAARARFLRLKVRESMLVGISSPKRLKHGKMRRVAFRTLKESITKVAVAMMGDLVNTLGSNMKILFKDRTFYEEFLEAVKWFHRHKASCRKLVGAPKVIFLHWEWMSGLVFSELLETNSVTIQSISSLVLGTADNPLTEWELIPTYHYQLAAHDLKEKRFFLELALSMIETTSEIDGTAKSVFPSIYVGDNYVHCLTQYETDGKLVELNAHYVNVDHGCGSCDYNDDTRISEFLLNTRVEVIVNKYSDLLTTQLENQKLYFESLLLKVKEEL
ncbi:hypothetical protein AAG906_001703 [Vitis piasezkii]